MHPIPSSTPHSPAPHTLLQPVPSSPHTLLHPAPSSMHPVPSAPRTLLHAPCTLLHPAPSSMHPVTFCTMYTPASRALLRSVPLHPVPSCTLNFPAPCNLFNIASSVAPQIPLRWRMPGLLQRDYYCSALHPALSCTLHTPITTCTHRRSA
jgi:hypothetical protein